MSENFFNLFHKNGSPIYLKRFFLICTILWTVISYVSLTSITKWVTPALLLFFMVSIICFSVYRTNSGRYFENIIRSLGVGMLIGFLLMPLTHDIYFKDGVVVYNHKSLELIKPSIDLNFGSRIYIVSEGEGVIQNVSGYASIDLYENFESKINIFYIYDDTFAIKNAEFPFKDFIENNTAVFFRDNANARSVNRHALEIFLCQALKQTMEVNACPIMISKNKSPF